MKNLTKTLLAAAGVFALVAGAPQAHAFTVSTGGIAAPDGSGLTTAIAGTTVINFNDVSPVPTPSGNFTSGGVSFTGQGQVVNGSSSGQFAAPAGDTTNYLIGGGPTSFTGTETMSIASSNYFGLFWGSMDAYNTLTFLNGSTVVATITGTDVAAGHNANGDQTGLGTNNYVNIFNLPDFTSVQLTTTQANFELDNVAFGQVPEPATLALFGMGLLGLGALRRKRNSDI